MKIFTTGLDYTSGKLLIPAMEADQFADLLRNNLEARRARLNSIRRLSATAATFRGEIERVRSVDLNDPRQAGWTFLINPADPAKDEVMRAIRPLAEYRGMLDPAAPLRLRDLDPESWFDWIVENYSSLETGFRPHFVLLLGGPDQIPFRFQSVLDAVASVGRLSFDETSELGVYVEKLLRLEDNQAPPATSRQSVVFGTNHGALDPTYFSHEYMVKPLAELIQNEGGLDTQRLLGAAARKDSLLEVLRDRSPALVYTASHGMGAPSEPLEVQKRVNGAICCQKKSGEAMADWLLTADDVPSNERFIEGGVFFQFACYGYGTPALSDYSHWLGEDSFNSQEDFVSALPKKLLSNPRGPVAYIGHVDLAWLHGFADPADPHTLDVWQPRIAPFVSAVRSLVQGLPVGEAMAETNQRYNITNALLTNTLDRLERGTLEFNEEIRDRFISTFITRSDAQNYMVLGDPAARVRIPTSNQ